MSETNRVVEEAKRIKARLGPSNHEPEVAGPRYVKNSTRPARAPGLLSIFFASWALKAFLLVYSVLGVFVITTSSSLDLEIIVTVMAVPMLIPLGFAAWALRVRGWEKRMPFEVSGNWGDLFRPASSTIWRQCSVTVTCSENNRQAADAFTSVMEVLCIKSNEIQNSFELPGQSGQPSLKSWQLETAGILEVTAVGEANVAVAVEIYKLASDMLTRLARENTPFRLEVKVKRRYRVLAKSSSGYDSN